jgi:hypothetical protein
MDTDRGEREVRRGLEEMGEVDGPAIWRRPGQIQRALCTHG